MLDHAGPCTVIHQRDQRAGHESSACLINRSSWDKVPACFTWRHHRPPPTPPFPDFTYHVSSVSFPLANAGQGTSTYSDWPACRLAPKALCECCARNRTGITNYDSKFYRRAAALAIYALPNVSYSVRPVTSERASKQPGRQQALRRFLLLPQALLLLAGGHLDHCAVEVCSGQSALTA